MSNPPPTPLIGVTSCLKSRDEVHFHSVGDKYVDAVVAGAAAVPVLIPALGERLDPDSLLSSLDGLMVTGSPSNVDPSHYGGPPAREGNEADPARDATTLPLIRRAIARGVPMLCICRGLQELNVALGGSLHQHVHEVEGRRDHRSPKSPDMDVNYAPAHEIDIAEGGLLQQLLGERRVTVNSLHAQGVDVLAPRARIEATCCEDGQVEALSVPDAPGFVLALQWHPEYKALENPVSMKLFDAFSAACRARMAARSAPLLRAAE